MTDPHWTSYVGMGTGILGAATGIAGAIMGWVSYRKSNKIKKLDLRIELKRASTDVNYEYKELLRKMKDGNKSRRAVTNALGISCAGWNLEFSEDEKTSNQIAEELPAEHHDYKDLDDNELENKLIEIHKIGKKVEKLTSKYNEAWAWDEKKRREIHESKFSNSNR
jgi:hypothetical protein